MPKFSNSCEFGINRSSFDSTGTNFGKISWWIFVAFNVISSHFTQLEFTFSSKFARISTYSFHSKARLSHRDFSCSFHITQDCYTNYTHTDLFLTRQLNPTQRAGNITSFVSKTIRCNGIKDNIMYLHFKIYVWLKKILIY